jgi:hypothetical protein
MQLLRTTADLTRLDMRADPQTLCQTRTPLTRKTAAA